jgi:hypothetical protein
MQFKAAVQALCDAGVDFVVIGGLAATIHGSAHITFVLDICYSRASPNLKRLALALAPFHPRLRDLPRDLPFVWDDATLRNGTVFTLETDLGRIDLLAEVAGVGVFEDALRGSIKVEAFERQVSILDLPSLIASKRAAGRGKDLQVLPELESLADAQQPE